MTVEQARSTLRERISRGATMDELETLLRESLFRGLLGRVGPARLEDAARSVARRERDPYSVAEELLGS